MNTEQRASILIVDDLPDNLLTLAAILCTEGYKVRKATSGQMALDTVGFQPPDLILLDIKMPQMDGYEVCSTLKAAAETRSIPVIFLSALDETADKVKAFTVGGVDYITKPFQAEEVIARVENQLRLTRLSRQLIEQNSLLQNEIRTRKQTEVILQQEIGERKQAEARERKKAQELKEALDELKRTQSQLIQTDKMSSLGRMVAGVAHEINNPVNFIYGNLFYVKNAFQDLLKLIEVYQQTYPNPTSEIQELASEIDLEFLVKDWANLMHSMQIGTERVQAIVQSLKTFSRLDEAELKPIDIHEGIDNTLLILQPRLKGVGHRPEIQVIKDYGQLPLVTCYGSQLNQVFMNLLNNAIDAVETQAEPRRITIHTTFIQTSKDMPVASHWANQTEKDSTQTPNHPKAIILITDSGSGMSEEIVHQIFDPFFTTKAVGSGTGLGLSISHQIVVEKHRGKLSCISAPGYGTAFIVEIPILAEVNQE